MATILITAVDGVLGASFWRNDAEALQQVRKEIEALDPHLTQLGEMDEDALREVACDAGLDFKLEQFGPDDMTKHLAEVFARRAAVQGFKGKQRDNALIEFMVGAYAALEASLHPDQRGVSINLAMGFCPRGYAYLEEKFL